MVKRLQAINHHHHNIMTAFTKLVGKIRQLKPADDTTKLLIVFAEQMSYTRRNLRKRKRIEGEPKCCGGGDISWIKQRLEDKLKNYCDMFGHKELLNG